MNTDLLLLTLLFAVTLSAFIGALNARGPGKTILSFFLAILCLSAAVFHTSQYVAYLQAEKAIVEAVVAEPLPPVPAAPDTSGLAASRNAAELGRARTDLSAVVSAAQRLQRSLSAMDLSRVADVSEGEYESLVSRSHLYLAEARKIKEKVEEKEAGLPSAILPAFRNLEKAVEQLSSGAVHAERFFKAENETDERSRRESFRAALRSAANSLQDAEKDLGAAAP
jgi:hypothetical protein